jgi:hypothetical protein
MATKEDKHRNVRQMLWRCIESISTGTGTIQERLMSSALLLPGLGPGLEQLPAKSRHTLGAIVHDLTKEGDGEVTLRNMNEGDAERITNQILSLYIELRGGDVKA